MSDLLSEILNLLGHERPSVTAGSEREIGQRTPPVTEVVAFSNLQSPSFDRRDRCDRETAPSSGNMARRGRFAIGMTYRLPLVERFHRLSAADREATIRGGFDRAGIVVIEGIGLLVDDVGRAFADQRALVIGFVDLPTPTIAAGEPRRKRRT